MEVGRRLGREVGGSLVVVGIDVVVGREVVVGIDVDGVEIAVGVVVDKVVC